MSGTGSIVIARSPGLVAFEDQGSVECPADFVTEQFEPDVDTNTVGQGRGLFDLVLVVFVNKKRPADEWLYYSEPIPGFTQQAQIVNRHVQAAIHSILRIIDSAIFYMILYAFFG